MPTAATTRSAKTLLRWPISSEKGNEILGLVLGAFVLLLFGSLASHHPLDPSWLHHAADADRLHVRNFVGPFGAHLSAVCFAVLGLVAFLLPALLAIEAWRRLTHQADPEVKGRGAGVAGVLLVAPGLTQLILGEVSWRSVTVDAGGSLGVVLAEFLSSKLNPGGAFVVMAAVLLVAGSLVAKSTLGAVFGTWRSRGADLWGRGLLTLAQRRKRRREQSVRRRVVEHRAREQASTPRVTEPGSRVRAAHARASTDVLAEPTTPRVRRGAAETGEIEPLPPRPAPGVGPGAEAVSAPRLDLPLRVTEKKGEGQFAVRRVKAPALPGGVPGSAAPGSAVPGSAVPGRAMPGAGTETANRSGAPRIDLPLAPGSLASGQSPGARASAGAPVDPSATRAAAAATAGTAGPGGGSARPSMPVLDATHSAPRPLGGSAPPPSRSQLRPRTVGAGRGLPPSTTPPPPVPVQADLEVQPELPELPPVNLLNTERPELYQDEADLVAKGETIRDSCEHFGVDGNIAGIGPGPVITVFEFQPAPGVKVSKVVNLQDDLALALRADSVRIDRIPGRSTLGMEVPNERRSIIHLGQLLAEEPFRKAKSVLTMALGCDIHGRPVYHDLATMPHLLVAGATGAGKSVGLQSMITSILYKSTKDEVKFIFIDPKRVELGVYSSIPHLKTEVVVEPKKAANALRWAVAEMERRYRLLAEVHVRSIDIYNRAIRDPEERRRLALKEGESEFSPDDFKPLPYYVIIIDELADLMMVASSEVESSIARLAQMARAVGIHLIVATQRPSVDVLTGTIKANFPCRLAFATATRHDSRTILDQVGAEKLLGKGDALFMPPGTSRIMRLHGAYISEQETASLIRWMKRRGKPDLDMDVVKPPEDEAGSSGGSGGGDDPLFEDAARLVVKERQGSASFLQRRMRVGFSRAARLIDMLEADGLLGPAQGSKPRDVLVPVDYFDELEGHQRAVEGE